MLLILPWIQSLHQTRGDSTCGGEMEVWTRVMGYFRPVSSFNTGKKGEHHERLPFAQGHVA